MLAAEQNYFLAGTLGLSTRHPTKAGIYMIVLGRLFSSKDISETIWFAHHEASTLGLYTKPIQRID